MTPEQFVSLDTIKTKCGIDGTALDAQLAVFRDTAIGTIENRTRRRIADQTDVKVRSPDRGSGKSYVTFYIHDAKPITEAKDVTYRTVQEEPGFVRDGTLTIPAEYWEVLPDRVRVYNGHDASADGTTPAGVDPWPDRDMTVFLETSLDVGIAPGKSPAEFTAAALMLIRELQEGSLIDALPHNIVDLVLKDHAKPAFTATDETLADAGVM